jgi:hypothetical protein
MADEKPTSTDAFSGAAQPKTITFTDFEKFQIQQDAKREAVSAGASRRPFGWHAGG